MPNQRQPFSTKAQSTRRYEPLSPPPPPAWQVVEIEGEATPVRVEPPVESPPVAATVALPTLRDGQLAGQGDDRIDDKIVVNLAMHHLTIAAGETALFEVSVLNNGERRAHFELMVEGAIDPQWLVVTAGEQPPQPLAPVIALAVGERATFWLALTPPRAPQSSAGDHPLRISVRAAEYPGRLSQLAARLTILAYVDFTVGVAKPAQLTVSWRPRRQRITVPLLNHSNQPLTLGLRSRATAPHYRCEFGAAALQKDANGQPCVTLAAGQRLPLAVQLPLSPAAWLRLQKQPDRVQIIVAPLSQPEAIQLTQVQIQTWALWGPWQLVALMMLAGAGFSSALVFAVALLAITLRPAPAVVNPAPASSPPIAIVVNLAQPAAPAPSATLPPPTTAGQPLPNVVSLAAEQNQPDPALPLIAAEQVSAPGGAAPAAAFAPLPSALAPQASPSTAAPQTYQQMFQEIALRYDLNWRVLAAQAYVESGFDSLALGNSGDMGLMQILPATWREWAPVVNAVDPFDSYSNALVAARYLDYLRGELGKKGYPQIEWMLVAYNWGIDKVLDHLTAGQGWEALPAERRQYALDILRIAETIPVQ